MSPPMGLGVQEVVLGLLRAGVLLAAVVGPALALVALGKRLSARAQHAVLLAALLLGALAPLWLLLAGQVPEPAQATRPQTVLASADGAGAADLGPRAAGGATFGAQRALVAMRARLDGGAPIVLWLWLGGGALALLRLAAGLRAAARLRGGGRPVRPDDVALGRTLAEAQRRLGRALPPVRFSDAVGAAVVVGLWRPFILLAPALATAPPETLVPILLHEAAHARRRDPLTALLVRLVVAVYWFHPLVHLARALLARRREEACDEAVVPHTDRIAYARTLLALAERGPAPMAALLAVRADAGALAARIRRLVAPARPRGHAASAIAIATLATVVVAVAAPTALALAPRAARGVPAPTEPTPLLSPSLSALAARLFVEVGPQVRGAFVVRDLDRGETTIVNPALAYTPATPASTFKVLIALAALETGVAPDAGFTLPWDGRPRMAGWDRDLDLRAAMRTSATWYFEALEDRLPAGALTAVVRALGYGNQVMGGPGTRTWLEGPLQISAVEQVAAMARLTDAAAPFAARSRALLDEVTQLETRGGATLHGKTGTAVGDDGVAWLVGHTRGPAGRFAYASFMRAPAAQVERLRARRLDLTRTLLEAHGAYPAAPTDLP